MAAYGIPNHHVPVTRDTKPEAERAMVDPLAGDLDLVVLARYMQILSGDFLRGIGAPVINIHHSFLPAFAGADPYARAGRDIERVVLARAVDWHLQDRVLVHENRTIVF